MYKKQSKKTIVSIGIVCICIICILIILLTMYQLNIHTPITSSDNIDEFNKYRPYFENVYNKILNIDEKDIEDMYLVNNHAKDRKTFLIQHNKNDDYDVTGIWKIKDNYTEDILNDLNQINNYLKKDFEFIEYTPDRVSFQGDGQNMVVYSINGKIPNYFFYKGDKMSFRVYDVRNKWYILIANLR